MSTEAGPPRPRPGPRVGSGPGADLGLRRRLGLLGVLALLMVGCALQPTASRLPSGQASFADYQQQTRQWLAQRRQFQTSEPAAELAWNSPQEWRPAGPPRAGVLLLHGLGDSPGSFNDIGPALATQGLLVRTVLLPGHGSQPADMLQVQLEDWERLVQEQLALLKRDTPQVLLGGFSTGANLATVAALDDPAVRGLLLFSPAFRSDSRIDWLAPLLAWAKPWLREPDSPEPQQTGQRYLNMPTNGFAQYYRGSARLRTRLAAQVFDRPALLVSARHDSVVDVGFVLERFTQRFSHPASRIVWYGALPAGRSAPPRLLQRPDQVPADRVSQFSHMGVLFSPDNPVYGRQGSQRLCWNGQPPGGLQHCLAGGEVWFSDWGYTEPGKVHARLTFNPHFAWQNSVMAEVVEAALAPAVPPARQAGVPAPASP